MKRKKKTTTTTRTTTTQSMVESLAKVLDLVLWRLILVLAFGWLGFVRRMLPLLLDSWDRSWLEGNNCIFKGHLLL
jgi:hypothetical protein